MGYQHTAALPSASHEPGDSVVGFFIYGESPCIDRRVVVVWGSGSHGPPHESLAHCGVCDRLAGPLDRPHCLPLSLWRPAVSGHGSGSSRGVTDESCRRSRRQQTPSPRPPAFCGAGSSMLMTLTCAIPVPCRTTSRLPVIRLQTHPLPVSRNRPSITRLIPCQSGQTLNKGSHPTRSRLSHPGSDHLANTCEECPCRRASGRL